MRRITFLAALVFAAPALAVLPDPYQNDAGTGGDAPDSMDAAHPVAPGVVLGELSYPTDYSDWYRITIGAGAKLVAGFHSTDGGALEIYDTGGALVASTGPVYEDVAYASASGAGTWYLRSRIYAVGDLPYSITLTVGPAAPPVTADPVVVATLDTGTNPWHPCFRRPGLLHPQSLVPAYPASSTPLALTFGATYEASKTASAAALGSIQDWTLYHVQNTNLAFYGGSGARTQLVDDYPHGAQASSQIGCAEYGFAPNALVVILNWYDVNVEGDDLIRWAANQPWIDVIHLNIQDWPLLVSSAPEVAYAISKEKLVVVAAGNGVGGLGPNYPMELSKWNGPPGSLVAGAMANGGYTAYSNLNPHVAADGDGTFAASPTDFGTTTFGGTSSASPRISGYAARILGELRDDFGHTGVGLLTIPAGNPRPASGPLADGKLTAAELHEVVRKTADPNPHDTPYDGGSTSYRIPQPVETPFAFYPKIGYGEVSDVTIPAAVRVASGLDPMPVRTVEDAFYLVSETEREAYWG